MNTNNSCILPFKKIENASAISGALSAIADKWTVPILVALQSQSLRFNELQRTLGDVTHRVLTTQLRKLESERLITRTVHSINPPHVVYGLAPEAAQLLPLLISLGDWQVQRNNQAAKEIDTNQTVAQHDLSTTPTASAF
jgi:DNA-binding HxlR family transcriptional regulator